MTAFYDTCKVFVCSLGLCVGGGWLTGLLTQHGVKEWYPQLIKPYGTPPNALFPIVWTLLYIFMAAALTIVWRGKSEKRTKALFFFLAQLFKFYLVLAVFLSKIARLCSCRHCLFAALYRPYCWRAMERTSHCCLFTSALYALG